MQTNAAKRTDKLGPGIKLVTVLNYIEESGSFLHNKLCTWHIINQTATKLSVLRLTLTRAPRQIRVYPVFASHKYFSTS